MLRLWQQLNSTRFVSKILKTIGNALKDRFDIHTLDLSNHGSSPHIDAVR
jgi:hypothetical protein